MLVIPSEAEESTFDLKSTVGPSASVGTTVRRKMPWQISQKLIAEKILSGIEKAQKEYDEWSGGDPFWTAPEYLLTTNIARSIADIDCTKYITLENSTSGAIKDAGAFTRGCLSRKARPHGRVDILLWWGTTYNNGNIYPRAVIEVKHNVYSYAHIAHDIDRIEKVVLKNYSGNTLQFGAIAFYTARDDGKIKTASEKIQYILDKIESEAKKDKRLKKFHVKLVNKLHKDGDSAWTAACLMLIPQNNTGEK